MLAWKLSVAVSYLFLYREGKDVFRTDLFCLFGFFFSSFFNSCFDILLGTFSFDSISVFKCASLI